MNFDLKFLSWPLLSLGKLRLFPQDMNYLVLFKIRSKISFFPMSVKSVLPWQVVVFESLRLIRPFFCLILYLGITSLFWDIPPCRMSPRCGMWFRSILASWGEDVTLARDCRIWVSLCCFWCHCHGKRCGNEARNKWLYSALPPWCSGWGTYSWIS